MNVDWMLAITVLVTGILVVFLVLILLVLLIALMGKIVGGVGKQGPSAPSGKASPVPPATPKAVAPKAQVKPAAQQDDLGEEVIAVISAAIAAIMDEEGVPAGSYTVKSIKRAREARPAWAMAGMQQNTRPF